MNETQYTVGALSGLRNKALLLNMANEYLCEDIYLNKFGGDIIKNVQQLKEDILSLKKEYPGKFASEVDTDSILEKINKTAESMVESGDKIKNDCASGELGKKLESDIKSAADAVRMIRVQVYGETASYSKMDSVFNIFERIKDFGRSIGGGLYFGGKIFLCILSIALILFLYLFFTMEKESSYRKKVEESQVYINTQQELLSRLESQKNKISEEVKLLDSPKIERDKKIAILDLEVDIHKINQDIKETEADIIAHEKMIQENNQKIEEIKSIPFVKRLLRQDN